ncbi:SDR family oxidoreductase [Vogesella indigofera]|uniref:SDR family oxidoreductase n=1 Tax=Vogesella indigofera TaxID=45465 RepID=UPI00234EF28F|nr:SDR family oxidoreductase [Vogesella indigofera]MDC7712363.1 SDR family oxidoreductase [Vogesella indigofera]
MDLGIKDKTALVLSAGGGLGSAIAVALAREGAKLCLADINADALANTVKAVESVGGQVLSFQWDLGDLQATETAVSKILEATGGVDILINNTGGPAPGPAFGHSSEVWEKSFRAMVVSVIAITDQVLPGMRRRGWGRVITSTSSGVVAPIANLGLSNATRIALLGWSKSLARDIAADGVTANVVIPGRIATARTQFLDEAKAKREGREAQLVSSESAATIPMGRYGTPEEYANAVAFLASGCASYITGSVIRVDGGMIQSI